MIVLITAADIRKAFVDLINNEANIPYEVHFNNVNKSNDSYVWVDLHEHKTSLDEAYFQWNISVDIQVIIFPSQFANVKHTDLWDISDALTGAIMPCLKIKDRFITIQEFDSYIIDDVLHYEFSMDFTDYVKSFKYEGSNYDLMQNLELALNDKEV